MSSKLFKLWSPYKFPTLPLTPSLLPTLIISALVSFIIIQNTLFFFYSPFYPNKSYSDFNFQRSHIISIWGYFCSSSSSLITGLLLFHQPMTLSRHRLFTSHLHTTRENQTWLIHRSDYGHGVLGLDRPFWPSAYIWVLNHLRELQEVSNKPVCLLLFSSSKCRWKYITLTGIL